MTSVSRICRDFSVRYELKRARATETLLMSDPETVEFDADSVATLLSDIRVHIRVIDTG